MDASSILTFRDAEAYITDLKIEVEKLKFNVSDNVGEYKIDLCEGWKKQSEALMQSIDNAINNYKLLRIKTKHVRNIPNELLEYKKQCLSMYNSFDEMIRKIEKQQEETDRKYSNKKYNVVEEMDWVFSNLGNELVKESESPTSGSFYYLKKLQSNEDMMEDFYKMYIQRRMPSRDEIDEMEKKSGDTSDEDLKYVYDKLNEAMKEINK